MTNQTTELAKKMKTKSVRNAVESSIELAKSDRQKTWEQLLRESPATIGNWDEMIPAEASKCERDKRGPT